MYPSDSRASPAWGFSAAFLGGMALPPLGLLVASALGAPAPTATGAVGLLVLLAAVATGAVTLGVGLLAWAFRQHLAGEGT